MTNDPMSMLDSAIAQHQLQSDLDETLMDIIETVDSLDRLQGDLDEAHVEALRRQLEAALARRGVTPFESVGQQFDPHLHEAAGRREEDGVAAGVVLEQKTRGYLRKGASFRPPKVIVAA